MTVKQTEVSNWFLREGVPTMPDLGIYQIECFGKSFELQRPFVKSLWSLGETLRELELEKIEKWWVVIECMCIYKSIYIFHISICSTWVWFWTRSKGSWIRMIALVVFVSSDRPYSFSMLQRCHCTCHLPNLKDLEIIEHLMKSADIRPTFVHLSNQATSIRSSVISGVGAEAPCKASVTLSFNKFVQSVFSLICAKKTTNIWCLFCRWHRLLCTQVPSPLRLHIWCETIHTAGLEKL